MAPHHYHKDYSALAVLNSEVVQQSCGKPVST